jgi:large conductance mechanosensitive channel
LFESLLENAVMGILQEFKAFAMRGNVVDLAVGVVIGGAFGKIVTSLVNDLIMPPLNLLTAASGVNFKELAVNTTNGDGKVVPVLNYGAFLQNIVDFVIVAFAIFMVVRLLNSMKKKEEAAPAPPAEDIVLLREIRDALAKSTPRRSE